MAAPTAAEVNARVDLLEKKVMQGRHEDLLTATTITQSSLLDSLTKSYDKNIKINGLKYKLKDSKTYNAKSYQTWCAFVIKTAMVIPRLLRRKMSL